MDPRRLVRLLVRIPDRFPCRILPYTHAYSGTLRQRLAVHLHSGESRLVVRISPREGNRYANHQNSGTQGGHSGNTNRPGSRRWSGKWRPRLQARKTGAEKQYLKIPFFPDPPLAGRCIRRSIFTHKQEDTEKADRYRSAISFAMGPGPAKQRGRPRCHRPYPLPISA